MSVVLRILLNNLPLQKSTPCSLVYLELFELFVVKVLAEKWLERVLLLLHVGDKLLHELIDGVLEKWKIDMISICLKT